MEQRNPSHHSIVLFQHERSKKRLTRTLSVMPIVASVLIEVYVYTACEEWHHKSGGYEVDGALFVQGTPGQSMVRGLVP